MKFTISFLFSSYIFALDSYPEWFLYPNRYPGTIVGYHQFGNKTNTNALRRHCVYKYSYLKGSQYIINNQDKTLKKYFYEYDPTCLENDKDRLNIIDYFNSSTLTRTRISLYSIDSLISVNRNYFDISLLEPPKWIDEMFWFDNEYYYAVGEFTSRGQINDAWETAEETAIYNLAACYAVNIGSVSKLYIDELGEDFFEEVFREKFFHKLKNIEVLNRWPDKERGMYYVKIRIKKENIESPFRKE